MMKCTPESDNRRSVDVTNKTEEMMATGNGGEQVRVEVSDLIEDG
jgi:hypothetical protein